MSTLQLIESGTLVQQGAEARVYRVTLHPSSSPILLKHRFTKKYRHSALDTSLTRSRVVGEARALLRCLRSGVCVPGVKMVDVDAGVLGIEWIDGEAVRHILPGGGDDGDIASTEGDIVEDSSPDAEEEESPLLRYGIDHGELMTLIGVELAKMHLANIIHGDLTTSNMMLRKKPNATPPAEIVLIDFGLTSTSTLPEDKAVDLYVLERAFASTHPDSEPMFEAVLQAYARQSGKAWDPVKRRLDDVRLRGRKRSMVG